VVVVVALMAGRQAGRQAVRQAFRQARWQAFIKPFGVAVKQQHSLFSKAFRRGGGVAWRCGSLLCDGWQSFYGRRSIKVV